MKATAITTSEFDKASDVYSYAIILWELLERRVVWAHVSVEQVEQLVTMGNRPPISNSNQNTKESMRRGMVSLMQDCWSSMGFERPT